MPTKLTLPRLFKHRSRKHSETILCRSRMASCFPWLKTPLFRWMCAKYQSLLYKACLPASLQYYSWTKPKVLINQNIGECCLCSGAPAPLTKIMIKYTFLGTHPTRYLSIRTYISVKKLNISIILFFVPQKRPTPSSQKQNARDPWQGKSRNPIPESYCAYSFYHCSYQFVLKADKPWPWLLENLRLRCVPSALSNLIESPPFSILHQKILIQYQKTNPKILY